MIEPKVPASLEQAVTGAITKAYEMGYQKAAEECAALMRKWLQKNEQTPASWHEVEDCAVEMVRRAKERKP